MKPPVGAQDIIQNKMENNLMSLFQGHLQKCSLNINIMFGIGFIHTFKHIQYDFDLRRNNEIIASNLLIISSVWFL